MENKFNLLVHTCCAPCLTYMDKYFRENSINYTSFFYNPNIHPYKEYERRFDTLKKFLIERKVKLIHLPSFMQKKYEENKNNCDFCYNNRLEITAKYASEHGFTHFTSTLFISPYQAHEKMIDICKKLEIKYNIKFYYYDFRPYFREGQNLAREANLYRQKYCGCINSYNSSKFKAKITWD